MPGYAKQKNCAKKILNRKPRNNISFEERVKALISEMTVEEKLSQLFHVSPAIPRLKVPAYDWWNECLHGVARAGIATVFPQAIGLAACYDTELMHEIACAISDEARAKHHAALKKNERKRYFGLTFWTPNINIYRDPRWGRGQETYGECPYLTSRLAVAFIKGLQGNDKKYLKAAACAKHFAVHSGPEFERHSFNAVVSKKDMADTYLPAFEAAVREAGVEAVMTAYNRVNGVPASCNEGLLVEKLRGEWGFKGHVVSDCGALRDIYTSHGYADTPEETAAECMKAGLDLNCCNEECDAPALSLKQAYKKGMINEAMADVALERLFMTRFRLGMFDEPGQVKYSKIRSSAAACAKNRKLSLKAAEKSIVLLKNDSILPVNIKKTEKIAVIGAIADDVSVLLGNYSGTPLKPVTILEGIKKLAGKRTDVYFAACYENASSESKKGFKKALAAAAKGDIIIFVCGLTPHIEGEECDIKGERESLVLPGVQEESLLACIETGRPVIVVSTGGGAISLGRAQNGVKAHLHAWYPGESGGTAVANILSGKVSPSGRLPITFYRSIGDIPDYRDYSMKGRTYRYFEGVPLYPFGYGLSYADFEYSRLVISPSKAKKGTAVVISVDVRNSGETAADEVVQLYIRDTDASVAVPLRQLAGFKRVSFRPGEKKRVVFTLTPAQLSVNKSDGRKVQEKGFFEIWAGSPGANRGIMPKKSKGVANGILEVI